MIILYSKMILSVILVIALIIVIAPLIAIFCVPGLAKVEKHIASKVALVAKHVKQEAAKTYGNLSFIKAISIFPGTKWCGDGNISTNYQDLGPLFRQEDACCRAHDHCNDSIEGGKTKYGLTNYALTTFSACHCDQAFYDCLKNASSTVANSLGFALFTLAGAQCFKVEYPIIKCAKMVSVEVKEYQFTRCGEYLYNKSAPKIHQWFDNPLFEVPDILKKYFYF